MGKGKDLTTAEKQKITKLFSERMSTYDISKELWRDHQMIKNGVANITKLRTQSKRKGFQDLFTKDEHKIKLSYSKATTFNECSDYWKGWNWVR